MDCSVDKHMSFVINTEADIQNLGTLRCRQVQTRSSAEVQFMKMNC